MSDSPALPPFPAISALNQTIRFFKDPFALTSQCRRELGDLFTLHLFGMGKWVFVSSPEHLKEVFKAPPDVLVSGEINSAMLGFLLGKDATFCLDEEKHLERRKLMHPYFNGRAVLEKVDLIRDSTLEELAKWPEQPFSFLPWAMHTSLAVIMRLVFGASSADELSELTSVFERYSHDGLRSPLLMMPPLQINLGRFSPWGRILEQRREVYATFSRAIAARRAEPELYGDGDIASILCRMQGENGNLLSEESIRDEILTDLFAGHETTAKVLTWAAECALTHPEALAKLRDEVDSALGGEPIRAEHLKQLPYTLAFLEETQRYRPLAPFAGIRLVKSPFQLGDFLLPPGTTVVQCLPLLAQRTEIFAAPDEFEPEHFFERKMKPFTWNPFGGGRRMCLGKGLAEVELAVFLATILSCFEISLAQETVERIRAGFFFAPSHGLLIEARRRTPSRN